MSDYCNHIVAFNGNEARLDTMVFSRTVDKVLGDVRLQLGEYIEEQPYPALGAISRQVLSEGDNKRVLREYYDTAEYCPICGEKIDWGAINAT